MESVVSPSPSSPSDAKVLASSLLCVDLDGTLIASDLLWECILSLLRTKPLWLLLIPYWLLAGRANLKHQLAVRANLNAAKLPYRSEVIEFLRSEKASGRQLVLVTAADQLLADGVAAHLGLFDRVHASDGQHNLKGARKAAFLREVCRESGFEYVGDSQDDLPVWRTAAAGCVVGNARLASRAADVTEVRQVFQPKHPTLATWIKALRGHHWSKNLLLFLPLALAHRLSLSLLLRTAGGFVLFGTCASGLYILNDLLDLDSDRIHPWKRRRPFAAGEISIPQGLLIAVVLLAGSLLLSSLLSTKFGFALICYATMTMWYSLRLKKIVLLDAFVLSSFYSFRIIAGALITQTPLSQWFLGFSLFFFLSLAMAKRYSELVHAAELVKNGNSGRGYISGDRAMLMNLGVASSFSSVVILSLYVHSQEVLALYRRPERLLLLCPIILYWLSRLWLKAHRGELHEDPIIIALYDPVSYAVAAVCLVGIAVSMTQAGL